MAKAWIKLRDKKFPLDRSLTLIGPDSTNHILIDDQRVSGRHAFIIRDGETFELFDFKSSNGIKIEGKIVPHGLLRSGQTIEIGEQKMTFEQAGMSSEPAGERALPEPTVGDTLVPDASPRLRTTLSRGGEEYLA